MKRNYGIDLLRIVSMFYVIVLHSLLHGGVLAGVQKGSHQYAAAWILEIGAYCAVNCFALISGYVGYSDVKKPHKYSNYIQMWLQIVFYGVVIMLLAKCIHPEWVTKMDVLKTLFPVTNSLYWYFSAYTGLFLCMPFINSAIRNTSEGSLKKCLLGMFILFSVMETNSGSFAISGGYSFVWLCILYFAGGVIKKCHIGERITNIKSIAGIIILILGTWLWKTYGIVFNEFGAEKGTDILIGYTSPTIVGISLFHIFLFSKLKIGSVAKKIIAFMAPAAFAAYILNNHSIIMDHIITGRFASLAAAHTYQLVFTVLGFSFLFLMGSILIDRLRILAFKAVRLDKFSDMIEDKVRKML